jgi:hypothetical protein
MREVSLNATRQAQGPQKIAQAQGDQTSPVDMVSPTDAMEANLTRTPDFTRVEADVEARFDQIKDRLRADIETDRYPPEKTIDDFAKLIASEITPDAQ